MLSLCVYYDLYGIQAIPGAWRRLCKQSWILSIVLFKTGIRMYLFVWTQIEYHSTEDVYTVRSFVRSILMKRPLVGWGPYLLPI